jgi:hypothetical protein
MSIERLIAAVGITGLAIGAALYLLSTALAGYYVSAEKGRGGGEGLIFGLLFGPLGLLIAVLMPEPAARVRPAVPVSSIISLIVVAACALLMLIVLALAGPRPDPPRSGPVPAAPR